MRSKSRVTQFSFFLVITTWCLIGCEETESTIGFSAGENAIQTVMVDTFTVRLSTVLLDSIYSSGTNRALVGNVSDPALGKTFASSYFQIAPTYSSWIIAADAVYDSINLVLHPDAYYYGDTTKNQKIIVHQITQDLIARTLDTRLFNDIPASYFYRDQSFYNTSTTKTSDVVLGSLQYDPRPNSSDSLYIHLPNDLGKKWFELARINDQQITDEANFISEFKGIKLSGEESGSIIGFDVSKIKIRVYYHEATNSEYLSNLSFDLPVYSTSYQYNEIKKDFSGTTLASLERGKSISSKLTNEESYIQGGAGLIAKIEFPYLKLLNEVSDNVSVLQSLLVVNAVQEYPQSWALPSQLVLYYTNDLNIPTNIVASQSDATAANSADLSADTEFNSYSRYTFSINTYVTALVKGVSTYPKQLFIGLNAADFPSKVTRLRIGSKDNPEFKIKFQIYYSRYQNSQ